MLRGTANFTPCGWTWDCSRLKVAAEQSCSKTDKINFTTVYSSYVCCRGQITSHHADGPGAIADSSRRLSGASLEQTESTSTAVYSSHVCCRGQITSHHAGRLRAAADSQSQAERGFSRTDRINLNSSVQFSRVLQGTDNFTPCR